MSANISDQTTAARQKVRKPFLPAWYLPNGTKNAHENELDGASDSCERWSIWCGALVLFSIIAEFVIAIIEPPYNLFLKFSIAPDAGVAIGIVGEVLSAMWNNRIQTELRNRSNKKLSAAIEHAAEANRVAEEEKYARVKLEAQLAPRMLNQEQWDLIQSLNGKFSAINIGFETDAESWWFATELRNAFMSAGIASAMFSRDPSVHSFSIMIFEPSGFNGARARTVGPLTELFDARHQLPYGTAAIIGGLPTDILKHAGDDEEAQALLRRTPMIVVGGRFIVPPSHWPRPKPKAGTTEISAKADPRPEP